MVPQRPHLLPTEKGRFWRRSHRRIRAVEPRRHTELAAYHVITGQMRYMIDGRVFLAGPRTLIWAYNDQSHMLVSETSDFDMWIFVLGDELVGDLPTTNAVSRLENDLRRNVFRLGEEAHQELLSIAAMASSVRTGFDHDLCLSWWAFRALAACEDRNSDFRKRCPAAVQRAIETISTDPSVTLPELSASLGLSESRIGRLFKRETGESLITFRNRCRLAEVDRLMAEARSTNLTQCAFNAGFGSYTQFFRVFSALRGQSPRTYYAL